MSRGPLEWVNRQPFRNASERLSARLPHTEVGRFARQLDDNSIWLLKSRNPMVWRRQDFGLEVVLPAQRTAVPQFVYAEMASAFWTGSWALLNTWWFARVHVDKNGSIDVKIVRESDGVVIWEQTGFAQSTDITVDLTATGKLPTTDDVLLLLVRKTTGPGGEVVSGRLSLA
jgi:hypothetical protein